MVKRFLPLLFIALFISLPSPAQAERTNQPKIINGEKPNMKNWSWIAALRNSNNQTFCTGSLIDSRWVLTAAHCIDTYKAKDINIVIGKIKPNQRGPYFLVKRIVSNPMYEFTKVQNPIHDIALIELTTPVKNITPVRIPLNDENNSAFRAKIAGYGQTCYGNETCDFSIGTLYQGVVRTISDSECARAFSDGLSRPIICTRSHRQSPIGDENICYGDSGGPLIATKNNRPLLIGVLSSFDLLDVDVCVVEKIAGYAPTFRYQKWISQYVNRSVKIEVPKFQLSGAQKNRFGLIRIKNLSSRFSLPLKAVEIDVAGLYCRTRDRSMPMRQCSINSNFLRNGAKQSRWSYYSRSSSFSGNGPLTVISNNCPGKRGDVSEEYYLTLLLSNQLPVLKPKKSCQIKIKIKPPRDIYLKFKNSNQYGMYSATSGIRGAELFAVSIDTIFEVNSYKGAVISTCTDSIPPMPAVLWYGNCKRDLKALRSSPVGQFILNRCFSARKYFPGDDSRQVWGPRCHEIYMKL